MCPQVCDARNNALSELYCPYIICVDTTVTFLSLIVSKITPNTLKMVAIFVKMASKMADTMA